MGDPVVLVVAESRYLAEDACELVEVDYEELPAVVSPEAALDPASPPIFEDLGSNVLTRSAVATFGDVEGAFARADRVVRADVAPAPPPERADGMPGCGLRLSTPSRVSSPSTRPPRASTSPAWILSTQLGMPQEKVRVLAGDIGGSFGLKIGADAGGHRLRRGRPPARAPGPLDRGPGREPHRLRSGPGRVASRSRRRSRNEGDILGLRVKMTIDTGAYPGMGGMLPEMVKSMIPGPYKIGALSFESTAVITNKASYVAYRGPWASETWVRERMIDLIARELGLEPLEVRLRNVVTRGEPPLETVTGRSLAGVTSRESLERIAALRRCGRRSAGARPKPGQGRLPRPRSRHLHRGGARTADARGRRAGSWGPSRCACDSKRTAR